jgi:hypothetical protein
VWHRIMFGLPTGQLSFLLRAVIDTLPTPVDLQRWRIQTDPSCPLCGVRLCTMHHILNCCPVSLNQGRYTWRHDSVLRQLVSLLLPHLPNYEFSLYADQPGHRAVDNPATTVPPSLVVTSARPDIIIINSNASHKTINLLELTVPTNTPHAGHGKCTVQEAE